MRQLVITHRHWETIQEGLIRRPDDLLVGATGLHLGGYGIRLLTRGLEPADRRGIGAWFARWRDLLVVARLVDLRVESASMVLRSLAPRRTHRLTLLLVGTGEEAGYVSGLHSFAGRLRPLDLVQVIGPGWPCWRLSREAVQRAGQDENGDEDDGTPGERWSRPSGALTTPVWRTFRRRSVAVVGCGRSGSLAAEILSLMGLGGALTLVDADVLEAGNLDATFGVTPGDVGRPKVEALARSLRRSRPHATLVAVGQRVESRPALAQLAHADLIVTTVDRDAPRLAVALFASAYLKPHLDVGTGIFFEGGRRRMGADVRFLVPGDGCVLCVGGLRDETEARRELLSGPGVLRPGRPDWREERAGSLATLNAMAVGCGVQLWLDFLAARVRGSRWVRLFLREDGRVETENVDATAADDCSNCRELGLGDYRFGDLRGAGRR